MRGVLADWECKFCGTPFEAWSDKPVCHYCGGTGERRYSKLVTHEWGGPRFIRSLQRSFNSRSDLNRWLADHHMTQSPTADKRGGAHLGDSEAYRDQARIYFDPKSRSARSKGTWNRVDPERR